MSLARETARWRKQGDGWDAHVSILFTEVVEKSPKYLTNPPGEGDIFKKTEAILQRCEDHLHKYSEQ